MIEHADASGETKAKWMAYSDSTDERKVTGDPAQDDITETRDRDEYMQILKEMVAELEEAEQIEENHIKSLSLEITILKQIWSRFKVKSWFSCLQYEQLVMIILMQWCAEKIVREG